MEFSHLGPVVRMQESYQAKHPDKKKKDLVMEGGFIQTRLQKAQKNKGNKGEKGKMKRKPVEEENGNRKFRTKGNGKKYVEETIRHAEQIRYMTQEEKR